MSSHLPSKREKPREKERETLETESTKVGAPGGQKTSQRRVVL